MKSFGTKCVFLVFLSLWIAFFSSLAWAQQVSLAPSTLSFGSVSVGSSKTQFVTVTNIARHRIGLLQATVSGKGYTISGISCPVDLRAGQSMSFSVTFTPSSVETDSGLVSLVTDNWWKNLRTSPSTSVLTMSGSGVAGGQIAISPASVAFGNVIIGNSQTVPATVTNNGGVSVTISAAGATGTGFGVTGPGLPLTLTAGGSVTLSVNFTATATGPASGTLAIVSDAVNSPLNVALSGYGTAPGQLSVTPGALTFGNVVVGANSALAGSLSATGAPVTVTSVSSNSSEFVLSGIVFPTTIAAGQSTSFTVTFTPKASGAASASLTFLSSGSNSPTLESLTGNGQTPQPHSVDLSWAASQSAGVVGYNIYRRTPTGAYSKINSSLDPDTIYADTAVTAGQAYCYIVKGVDNNGMESGPSNEVQTTIPNP